jgi:hypothetical protein
MLKALSDLIARLSRGGIRYCHWKSNNNLADSMEGRGDLDLLVDPAQRGDLEAILSELGYRLGRRPRWADTPHTAHFYGFDEATGTIIHLHVYLELLTGGSVLKNHLLPFGGPVLRLREHCHAIPTPPRDLDLCVFVIRKTIEFGSLVEAVMVLREEAAMQQELAWLSEGNNLQKAADHAAETLPVIDRDFFLRCAHALRDRSVLRRMRLGRLMKRRLSRYAQRGPFQAAGARAYRLTLRLAYRAVVRRQIATLAAKGSIVAVVGPDATGKSTVVGELENWLRSEFWVTRAHAGRPPATWLTVIPHLILPVLRRYAASYRTTSMVTAAPPTDRDRAVRSLRGLPLWVVVVRSLMVAYERRALVRRLDRKRERGAIVICDRYPSVEPGTMDGAQLPVWLGGSPASSLAGRLVDLERKMYHGVSAANVVVRLSVPIHVAIGRNSLRAKAGKESESYLRLRHQEARRCAYRACAEVEIDTSGPLQETLRAIKTEVWRNLTRAVDSKEGDFFRPCGSSLPHAQETADPLHQPSTL